MEAMTTKSEKEFPIRGQLVVSLECAIEDTNDDWRE
jgi:hypothetical protein